MKPLSAPLTLLLLGLAACLEQAGPVEELVLPGDPLPAIADDGSAPVREPSVIRGYDPSAPQQSIEGIRDGLSPSRLRFEHVEVDIGEIYQFDHRSFEFPFTVEGDEPVTVTNLDSNCGCTDARIRADWLAEAGQPAPTYVLGREIPPGAKGAVIGTFDSERKFDVKITTITLRGNMADTPVKLELHAKIRRVFDIKPPMVRFGEVLAGGGSASHPKQEIRIVAREPFEVTEWRRLPPGLLIEPVGEGEPTGYLQEWARTYRVTLGDVPEGSLQAAAIAATSIGADLEIPISASVIGPIKYTPNNRLAFGFPEEGEERTRTVEVLAAMDNLVIPAPIPSLSGDAAPHMRAEVEELEPGRLYRVAVTMSGGAPPGTYPGVLRLEYPEESGLAPRDFVISVRVKEKRG